MIPFAPSPLSGPAAAIMRQLNPRAVLAVEDGLLVAIEDAWDCPEDARLYRMEYRSTSDGRGAVAYCLSNPWDRARPSAGVDARIGHVFQDGFLCLGAASPREPAQSPRSLRDTVLRARYWCTAFSVLKETGSFPNP